MTGNERNGAWEKLAALPTKLTEEESERIGDMFWAATDPELQKLYPDEYVAVYKHQVVAHGHDLKALLEEAERVTGFDAVAADRSDLVALIAVQGPKAAEIVGAVCDADLSALKYYAGVAAGLEHPRCIGTAQRKRFLAEHLLSRGRRGNHLRRMQRMRSVIGRLPFQQVITRSSACSPLA